MSLKTITTISLILCIHSIGFAQAVEIDSCGLDSSPFLNQHEINFVERFLLPPYSTKKAGTIDPKKGFNFHDKKIAFYSCTINSNTGGKGVLSKKMFFNLFKPLLKGRAGTGIIKLTEMEKKETNGFDAVLIVDCPYPMKRKNLISKLAGQNE